MKKLFRRPSPAMIVAMVALIAALGGTAVGAKTLGKKTVKKIAGAEARDEIAQSLQLVTVEGPGVVIPPGGVGTPQAVCPSGYTVIGTGFNTGIGNADFVKKYGTFVGGFVDNDVSITITSRVQAICASFPNAASKGAVPQDQARADFQADVQRANAAH